MDCRRHQRRPLGLLAILCPWWANHETSRRIPRRVVERICHTSMVLAFGDRRYGNNLLLQPAADDAWVLG